MARFEIEVLPWAIDDARQAYLYLLERDERLADEFQRRVRRQRVAPSAERVTQAVLVRDPNGGRVASEPVRERVGLDRDTLGARVVSNDTAEQRQGRRKMPADDARRHSSSPASPSCTKMP